MGDKKQELKNSERGDNLPQDNSIITRIENREAETEIFDGLLSTEVLGKLRKNLAYSKFEDYLGEDFKEILQEIKDSNKYTFYFTQDNHGEFDEINLKCDFLCVELYNDQFKIEDSQWRIDELGINDLFEIPDEQKQLLNENYNGDLLKAYIAGEEWSGIYLNRLMKLTARGSSNAPMDNSDEEQIEYIRDNTIQNDLFALMEKYEPAKIIPIEINYLKIHDDYGEPNIKFLKEEFTKIGATKEQIDHILIAAEIHGREEGNMSPEMWIESMMEIRTLYSELALKNLMQENPKKTFQIHIGADHANIINSYNDLGFILDEYLDIYDGNKNFNADKYRINETLPQLFDNSSIVINYQNSANGELLEGVYLDGMTSHLKVYQRNQNSGNLDLRDKDLLTDHTEYMLALEKVLGEGGVSYEDYSQKAHNGSLNSSQIYDPALNAAKKIAEKENSKF